jgi:hypothetical protein
MWKRVGRMWKRLSEDDQTLFVVCVFAIPIAAFVAVYVAVNGYWLPAAPIAFGALNFAYILYVRIKRSSGKPDPDALPPGGAE